MGLLSKFKSKAQQQVTQGSNEVNDRMTSSSQSTSATARGFVTRRGKQLILDDKPFKFVSLNAPELLDDDVNGHFEIQHTMQSLSAQNSFSTSVTRTYTLRIKSQNIQRGHINGWSSEWNDWIWDEQSLKQFDLVLDQANKNKVKLIIPFINNGSESQETNWVGDFYNLISFKKNLNQFEECKKINWWKDEEMIESFKLIIDFLSNRRNTITGVLYRDDPCILAWETGNEMNHLGMRPAPASWTLTIANDIDIMSYHYYGDGDIERLKKDIQYVHEHNKVFIAGEFGFFSKLNEFEQFLKILNSNDATGGLIWSLRPASHKGGFKTHSEEGDIPGTKQIQHEEFDSKEFKIIELIRLYSFKILKLPLPKQWPIPLKPFQEPFWVHENSNGPAKISFQNPVWSVQTEILFVQFNPTLNANNKQNDNDNDDDQQGQEILSLKTISDSTKEGCLKVDVDQEVKHAHHVIRQQQQQQGHRNLVKFGFRIRGIGVDGQRGPLGPILWI
ncbi:hypothetical protein OIO90_000024 [Microbotryomycetes sp. JL221]|nr:hypothetical protein OIO90_000024 [Microbotryomycetes sp. JL221]